MLRYSISLDDYLGWLRWYWSTAAAMKRQVLIQRLSCVLMFGAFALLPLSIGRPLGAVPFVLLAVLAWAFIPMYVLAYARRNARRMMAEDDARFGQMTLTILDDSISVRSERMQIRLKLSVIREIDQLPTALYLRYSSVDAIVVPLQKVTEGDPAIFLRTLEAARTLTASETP